MPGEKHERVSVALTLSNLRELTPSKLWMEVCP